MGSFLSQVGAETQLASLAAQQARREAAGLRRRLATDFTSRGLARAHAEIDRLHEAVDGALAVAGHLQQALDGRTGRLGQRRLTWSGERDNVMGSNDSLDDALALTSAVKSSLEVLFLLLLLEVLSFFAAEI